LKNGLFFIEKRAKSHLKSNFCFNQLKLTRLYSLNSGKRRLFYGPGLSLELELQNRNSTKAKKSKISIFEVKNTKIRGNRS